MKLDSHVSSEIVAGMLIGSLCLSGILYVLNSTEDEALGILYSTTIAEQYESH